MRRGEFVQGMDEAFDSISNGPAEGFAGGGIVKLLSKYIGKKAAEEAAERLRCIADLGYDDVLLAKQTGQTEQDLIDMRALLPRHPESGCRA